MVFQKIVVAKAQPLFKCDAGSPAEVVEAGAIHQFSWSPVGFCGVKFYAALVADNLCGGQRASSLMVISSPEPTLTWLCIGVVEAL